MNVPALAARVALAFVLCAGPAFGDAAEADAEALYAKGQFEQALPLYKRASEESGLSNAERAKRLRLYGDCLSKCNKPHEALEVFRKVEPLLPSDDIASRATNAMDQAVCAAFLNDLKSSAKLGATALAQGKLLTDDRSAAILGRATALTAYIDYVNAHYESAVKGFEDALALNEASKSDPLEKEIFRMKLRFSSAGANYHLGRWSQSTECFRKLLASNQTLFGANDVQTGWSHLALSDTLRKEGDNSEWKEHYAEAVRIFRRFNRDKLVAEYSSSMPAGKDRAELVERATKCVFGSNPSADAPESDSPPLCSDHMQTIATHDPCSVFVKPFEDAPGRVWANPWVDQKGMVIGVHGLSLQHSSYDALARRLADLGYTTVAFDMRGFGTYRQALGADRLDFDGCLEDLRTVVRAIRGEDRKYPMFMLGESMGGAIAMQFTAQHPDLVTGLIASVPAGKRYKQKRTAIKVAMTYIINKNKPINIGADVIQQATTNPDLKAAWENDPMTRSQLSPQELLQFQEMMNRNVEYAKKIKGTPVIVFQGVSDKLVKPDATYELFRAIGTRDKSFVMIGNTEHLIFEEGCFTEPVLAGLVAWMDSHRHAPAISSINNSSN